MMNYWFMLSVMNDLHMRMWFSRSQFLKGINTLFLIEHFEIDYIHLQKYLCMKIYNDFCTFIRHSSSWATSGRERERETQGQRSRRKCHASLGCGEMFRWTLMVFFSRKSKPWILSSSWRIPVFYFYSCNVKINRISSSSPLCLHRPPPLFSLSSVKMDTVSLSLSFTYFIFPSFSFPDFLRHWLINLKCITKQWGGNYIYF